MVFDLYREPLLCLIVRRSLRNSPRSKDAVHLQPQIEVQIPSCVLVDDKQVAGNRRNRTERLRRAVWRPLRAITGEVIGW
jgi:hypothetical protein